MRKFLIPLFLLSTVLVAANPLAVSAITLDPSSGNRQANTESVITIRPNALTGEQSIQLRMQVTNAQIISFSVDDRFVAIAQCAGNVPYTSTQICADMASTTPINNATDVIGTMRVRWGNVGTSTISTISGNAYFTTTDRPDVGIKGTYTIGNIPNTPLISAETDKYLLMAAGFGLIVFGAYLRKNSQLSAKNNYGN